MSEQFKTAAAIIRGLDDQLDAKDARIAELEAEVAMFREALDHGWTRHQMEGAERERKEML